ncbi:MAG: hypothetical protein ABIQ95_03165 [Bdellovibrionia bacterium]
MVFFNRFNLPRLKTWTARRVRAVSKSLTQLCGRHRTRLVGIAYFAISVVLGFAAFTLSREEAIEYWERTFLPSERVIHFALGSRGLIPATEGYHSQKALRSLPSSLDEKGSFWLNTDPVWVAVFLPSDKDFGIHAVAYCHDCKNFPRNWQPMGIGWRAMDKVIEQIDKGLRHRKDVKRVLLPKFQDDPREIVY